MRAVTRCECYNDENGESHLHIVFDDPPIHFDEKWKTFRTFVFLPEDVEQRPLQGYFMPLAELLKPIGKVIRIEAKTDQSLINFHVGLIKTDTIRTWPHQVRIERRWTKGVWQKCGFPVGSRIHYEAKVTEQGGDFLLCKPGNWVGLDEQERRMLAAGMFWEYWEKNNVPWKNRPLDFTAVGLMADKGRKQITHGNLHNYCKWSGLIPLSPEEQERVKQMLDDSHLIRRLLEEKLGNEVGGKIDLRVRGPLFEDMFIEEVLGRSPQQMPQKDLGAIVRRLLGGS